MKDFKIIEIMELFDEDEVIPASEMKRPQEALDREAFDDFNKRNPLAGGGMLVQPGFGGTRQGYAGDKSLKPGEKKTTSIGKEPGIIKISTRNSDKIKYVINYIDNDGNRKKFTSTESFKNITEAKEAKNKKIKFFEKQLNIPEGKLLDETYTVRRQNIRRLPKNKKDYITLTELRKLLGPRAEDMRSMGGSKDTVLSRASAKLLDQTKITTKDGANYFFYKKPTDKELNLLKTYIDARPIRKDMFERIQNLQKDKYTAKIVKDGKLPMNADGVLDAKFLKHVSKNYGTLDKYIHGLVRYTQALDGQTIIGLNDSILSDGKFKTNKKLASNIVNTFLEMPRGSSNASQNTIRKAVYKAAMNDITNELGNTKTTFENFKNQIRQKINIDFKLKGKGIEIDELIGVSTSFRNKTAPYAVFTQFVNKELNQGILKDYQKVVSNYTAQLKDEINKNSKFVNGKWQHSKKAKDIVNNFNKNIIPNLKNVDQLKGTNVSLPELTLGSPTDKTLGGTKGRLNQLENMGLNFREFYRQEGFGYKMPEGVVTQKEILDDTIAKRLLASFSADPQCRVTFGKGNKDGGRIGYATGPVNLTKCAESGSKRMERVIRGGVKLGAQEGALATQILRAGKSLGSAFTLSGLFGPAAIAFTAAAEAGIVGYDMLTTGKTFKETIGDSLFNYALGEKTKIDPDKELIKRFGKKDNQGNFLIKGMTDDKLLGIQQVLDQTNTLNTILKQNLKVEDLKDQVKFQNLQPKDTFMSPDDEMLQADTAMRTRQSLEDEQQKLNEILKDYRTPMSVDTGDLGDSVGLSMEDTIIGNMASDKFFKQKQDLAEAVKAAEIQKLESKGPVFMGKVFPKFEAGRQEDLLNLKSNINPAAAYAIESYENPGLNRFSPMRPFGLAGGGIAKLAGIDEGPQTVSMNPDSQGLRSLKNRVKNM